MDEAKAVVGLQYLRERLSLSLGHATSGMLPRACYLGHAGWRPARVQVSHLTCSGSALPTHWRRLGYTEAGGFWQGGPGPSSMASMLTMSAYSGQQNALEWSCRIAVNVLLKRSIVRWYRLLVSASPDQSTRPDRDHMLPC